MVMMVGNGGFAEVMGGGVNGSLLGSTVGLQSD